MYTPNPKHEFLIFSCDWKDKLDRAEQKEALRHALKVDGFFDELSVFTADERVSYCGPEGIESWIIEVAKPILSECAMEIFIDFCSAGDKATVMNWYFDGTQVYVVIGLSENWNTDKQEFTKLEEPMDYPTWFKYAKEINEQDEN